MVWLASEQRVSYFSDAASVCCFAGSTKQRVSLTETYNVLVEDVAIQCYVPMVTATAT